MGPAFRGYRDLPAPQARGYSGARAPLSMSVCDAGLVGCGQSQMTAVTSITTRTEAGVRALT